MKRKHQKEEDFNFWQPSTDMMTGLVLILLLVILLLGLFVVGDQESKVSQQNSGLTGNGGLPTQVEKSQGLGIPGLDGGVKSSPNTQGEYSKGTNTKSSQGLKNNTTKNVTSEKGTKTAVRVMVIDGDSEKTIKKKGISFHLLQNGQIISLSTYYPKKKSYTTFKTNPDGTFYLPEMIDQDSYELKNISVPHGYDYAGNTKFTVSTFYDYSNPYLVKVRITPAKNYISLTLHDDNGKAVSDATFDIYAKNDIRTADGTLRYKAGMKVASMTTDESGKAKSKKIYLGDYTIKQRKIPYGYTLVKDTDVKIVKANPTPISLTSNQSMITIHVVDALTSEALKDVSVEVKTDHTSQEYTTDHDGTITLKHLPKNTTYRIRQISKNGHYTLNDHTYKLTVDKNGYIKDHAHASLFITNKILRVNISVSDMILRNPLANKHVTLYKDNGEEVTSWHSDSSAKKFTNLTVGSYYVVIDGKKYHFRVTNSIKTQAISINIMTHAGIGILAGIIVAILLLIIVIMRIMKKGH